MTLLIILLLFDSLDRYHLFILDGSQVSKQRGE